MNGNKRKQRQFVAPTQEEVIKYFSDKGYKKEAAIEAFNYYNAKNWKNVKNWKQKMIGSWFSPANEKARKDENIEAKVKTRKNRVPLGAPRLRLSMSKREGYKRRWINDKQGRIAMAQEGGYTLVPKDGAEFEEDDVTNVNSSLNNAVSRVVDSEGTKAYLMEIPEDWYEEDQQEKQQKIDEMENTLSRGEDSHGKPGADGRYIPREGIKINRG